ncbi:hypothetical protein GCM10022251_28930 [Phytohabitans flavus]|uniref:Uncharacterized protein n=1 Tax=Phytohabitans flavus TaxID=1076124 RepID=A0A6F8XNU1_9ACTN|nr:hypothetical protein Pflav_018960 [Phytohabitans flavus]
MVAAWAALYGTLALVWTATGRGFPFGSNDPAGGASLLRWLPADAGAPLFAVVLLGTAVAALSLPTTSPRGTARVALLAAGWSVVALLLLVVPDMRLLARAGYAPMLIVGAPFGWPPVDYADVFTWQVVNMAISVAGGLLLARALLAWQFRTAGACVSCGRGDGPEGGWASARSAARWGRWAAYTAAAIPVVYALTRFAWLAAVLLGVMELDPTVFDDDSVVWAGAGLGAFGCVGAVLTLGLVQRWGEVFPRWMVGLAGRRVPVKLATVPATVVAVFVTSASLGMFPSGAMTKLLGGDAWLVLPMLLWPLWGVALGAAALAYHLRRRGACHACGGAG